MGSHSQIRVGDPEVLGIQQFWYLDIYMNSAIKTYLSLEQQRLQQAIDAFSDSAQDH